MTINEEQEGMTLAAILRQLFPEQSWSQVRKLVSSRRVTINDELCLDSARRLATGQIVTVRGHSAQTVEHQEVVTIRHLDEHIVVVEKPSGMNTVRHPSERRWRQSRKALSPTLEDIVPRLIAKAEKHRQKGKLPRLRVVHRLDKETSGLVVFARTVEAERGLGRQFHAHTVIRRYLAMVAGTVETQTIRSYLVRDRGDGRRGSTKIPEQGKEAITHVTAKEKFRGYTLLECRLETGRTHQIRIHLAELGYPVCGEKVYLHRLHGEPIVDKSKAPRLALHAAELGFEHPVTGDEMHWSMPLPEDLQEFLNVRQPRKADSEK